MAGQASHGKHEVMFTSSVQQKTGSCEKYEKLRLNFIYYGGSVKQVPGIASRMWVVGYGRAVYLTRSSTA